MLHWATFEIWNLQVLTITSQAWWMMAHFSVHSIFSSGETLFPDTTKRNKGEQGEHFDASTRSLESPMCRHDLISNGWVWRQWSNARHCFWQSTKVWGIMFLAWFKHPWLSPSNACTEKHSKIWNLQVLTITAQAWWMMEQFSIHSFFLLSIHKHAVNFSGPVNICSPEHSESADVDSSWFGKFAIRF